MDSAKRIAAMANEIWHEWYIGIISNEQIDYMVEKFQSEKSIENDIGNGYVYDIITFDGKDVGYFGYAKEKNYVYLSKAYVKKEYRGKGLGKKALQSVIEYARSNNLNKISLRVNRNNTDSVKAYEKWGFKKVKEDKADIGNGFFMDDFVMELNV